MAVAEAVEQPAEVELDPVTLRVVVEFAAVEVDRCAGVAALFGEQGEVEVGEPHVRLDRQCFLEQPLRVDRVGPQKRHGALTDHRGAHLR